MYIGDLGEDATRRELEEAFDKFGRVRNVWIAKRPPGGQTIKSFEINTSTGFAFVLMDDPRDAEDATRELDGSRMCGRRVKVQMSKPVRNHGDMIDATPGRNSMMDAPKLNVMEWSKHFSKRHNRCIKILIILPKYIETS